MRWWVIVGVVVALGVGVHYATDSNARFCFTHSCIGDFGSGNGSIVECSDGTWSHSGGVQGACSYHGGVGVSSFWSNGRSGSGYGGSGSGYGGSGSGYPTGSSAGDASGTPSQPLRVGPTRKQRAAAARRVQAARTKLYAITNALDQINDRLVKAKGVGSATDSAELDRIESRLTEWQIAHALDAPITTRTPLQRYADAAFSLASTLGLVLQDNGGGLWNSEWTDAIDKLNAAAQATG